MTTTWVITSAALVLAGILAWRLIQAQSRVRDAELRAVQVKQESALQLEQTNRLRDGLLKVVDDVLLVLDSERRILFANPAAESLLGQVLVGKTLIDVMRQPELEALIQDAQMVRGEGVERRIEFERYILHARAVCLHDNHNTLGVLTLRDVTEIQRLERARREMVANISHELSTPITSIGVLADTLLNLAIKEKPKRTRKLAANIRREVDTLTQLVQEMRDLSLIESGQMPIRLTPTNLLAVVQASVEPLLTLAENKEQTITLAVPEEISVLADDQQIQRAIKNIVHNAVKYSPEGGHIDVEAIINGDEAIIAVKDNGPGISPDDLLRIFERFFQVDRARHGGTGLGLAIVRHIVLAHGGRTWVESTEGHGATFYISLALDSG